MFRGYLAGSFCGLIVSGLGLGAISLLAGQPAGSTPPQLPVVESPDLAGAGDVSTVDGLVPQLSGDPGGAPAPSDTPEVDVDRVAVPGVQTETGPLAQPEAAEVSVGLTTPQQTADPVVPSGTDDGAVADVQTTLPSAPTGEGDVVVETATAEPTILPETEDVVDVDTPDTVEPETVPEVGLDGETEGQVETSDAAGDGAATPVEDEAVAVATDADAAVPDVDTTSADAPEGVEIPSLVTPEVDTALPVTPETDDATTEGTQIVLQGDSQALPGDGAAGLVQIGDAPVEPEQEPVVDATGPSQSGALFAYASDYEAPVGTPMVSIILIDDGSLPGGEAAVGAFPFAVSIAIDPAVEGATERMAAYRNAGIEVLALIQMPSGALPTDADVVLQASFSELDQSIALLDLGQAGIQSNQAVSSVAMSRLAQEGRGLVTLGQGLNSGLRAAEEANVPAAVVYRDLDADGQDATVIRRFLDQAAFRARQQGTVVLVGRVRPDTISALTLWSTASQGGEISLAPVSAFLQTQVGE